jgi:glycerol-3-phosphate dehydrogenase
MEIAVVGGGVNGLMTAWGLARRGVAATVFERGKVLSETSAASSKLIHGGIRYLEHGHLRLVRQALRERRWWLDRVPEHVWPLELLIPVYRGRSRGIFRLAVGAKLYEWLAGRVSLGPSRWYTPAETRAMVPLLRSEGLQGSVGFFDAMMDDDRLGAWVVAQVRAAGVSVREGVEVTSIGADGELRSNAGDFRFDAILNVAGPWARALLARSGLASRYDLDAVRGSHLIVGRELGVGLVLQVPCEARIVFALPFQGRMLLGTTEVPHDLAQPIVCAAEEKEYLLTVASRYFASPVGEREIVGAYAGVRPIVKRRSGNFSRASREAAMERQGRVFSVFGGKWTSARTLGESAAEFTLRELRRDHGLH